MSAREKDLKELLEYYEQNLCHKIFKYELNNKINIEVIFYIEGLCHLLGIQHIYDNDKRYLGRRGYNLIKTEKLKRANLKKHNEAEYKKIKLRLRHFDEIGELLCSGTFLKFYPERVKPRTQIRADFIIYRDKKEYLLHLFLIKENDRTNQYSPISFIVKKINDKSKEQYIKNQEYKKITAFEIIKK